MTTELPSLSSSGQKAGSSPPDATFSEELAQLGARFSDRPLRLREILEATQGRSYYLLLFVVALPFVGPIPLPGLSIPFGLVVSVVGLRLAFNRGPWIPERLLEREISSETFRRVLKLTARVVRGLEFFVRPRLGFVVNHVTFSRVAGMLIASSGLMLMLPLPLPFSNSLPAWSVLLLAAGALGRDGLFFFAGCAMFVVSLAFFAFVAFSGAEAFEWLFSFFNAGGK